MRLPVLNKAGVFVAVEVDPADWPNHWRKAHPGFLPLADAPAEELAREAFRRRHEHARRAELCSRSHFDIGAAPEPTIEQLAAIVAEMENLQ